MSDRLAMSAPRGTVLPCFDGDWNARADGNRMWDLVDVPEDELPVPGDFVVLAIAEGGRRIGEAMMATVHAVRRPEANPAAGWVVLFDWLPEHVCHGPQPTPAFTPPYRISTMSGGQLQTVRDTYVTWNTAGDIS